MYLTNVFTLLVVILGYVQLYIQYGSLWMVNTVVSAIHITPHCHIIDTP